MIEKGIDEIVFQYTKLLSHLRAHSEVLTNLEEVVSLSPQLRNVLKVWLEVSSKEESELLEMNEKQEIPLSQTKQYYDKMLNLSTCRCLLGFPPNEKKYNEKYLTAFDRFSAYLEFSKENLTKKFTKSDIEALKLIKLKKELPISVEKSQENHIDDGSEKGIYLLDSKEGTLSEWITELSKKFKKKSTLVESIALDIHEILSSEDLRHRDLPYSAKKDNFIYTSALVFYAVHQSGIYSGSKYNLDPCDWFGRIKAYRRKYSEVVKTIETMYFILPVNLISELQEKGMSYYPHIPQVEKIKLHKTEELSHACHLSKNLYNHVNWFLHTMYQTTFSNEVISEEDVEQRRERERRQADNIEKIKAVFERYDEVETITVKKRKVKRWDIYANTSVNGFPLILDSTYAKKYMPTIVKYSRHYRALPARTSQQIIRVLCNSWNSYIQGVREYNQEPTKFKARPSPPGYKGSDGEFSLYFTNQDCSIRNRYLIFPHKTKIGNPQFSFNNAEEETKVWEKYITKEGDFTVRELELLNKIPIKADRSYVQGKKRWFDDTPDVQNISVRERVNPNNFQQVRIIPRGKSYKLEIVYNKRLKETKVIDEDTISKLKTQIQKINRKRNKTKREKKNIHDLRKQIKSLKKEKYDRFSKNLKRENAITIDFGANILLSIANNIGENPILIKGNYVKIANFKALKHLKRIQKEISALSDKYAEETINPFDTKEQELEITNFFKSIYNLLKYESLEEIDRKTANRLVLELSQVLDKRNHRIESEMHRISRFVIEYCKHREIGTIVIGYNEGWKQGAKLEHKSQEKFMKIPFAKLKDMIVYKARLSGIDAFTTTESHTSKCSALDGETVEHHEVYMGLRGPSMKRSKPKRHTKKYNARGLFRTPRTIKLMKEKGTGFEYIHSDINGALNIGRKGAPEYFNSVRKKEMKLSPIFVKDLSIGGAHATYNTS